MKFIGIFIQKIKNMGSSRDTKFNKSNNYEIKQFACKCGFQKICKSDKQMQLFMKLHEKYCSGENTNPDFEFTAPIVNSLSSRGRTNVVFEYQK